MFVKNMGCQKTEVVLEIEIVTYCTKNQADRNGSKISVFFFPFC